MRETKSRAWHDTKKKMIYPPYRGAITKCAGLIEVLQNQPIAGGTYQTKIVDSFNGKKMDSTGLSDKNGVEIYEGDILESGKIVKWGYVDNCGCCGDTPGWNIDAGGVKYDKIIGNIYENKELL